MILYILTFSLLPHIVPLQFQTAKSTLNNWKFEAYANGDIETGNSFKYSLNLYKFNSFSNIGCIGVSYKRSLKALLLMEKIHERIHIWDISCTDYSSGSLLVKALVATECEKIIMMNTVNDKWKIARLYYLKSDL